MSFKTDLMSKVRQYTPFKLSYGGVTRELKIPYYWGGKKTPIEIKDSLLNNASIFTNGQLKSASEIQSIMNSNKSIYGVDCSGFAYYVLNEASDGAVMEQFNGTPYSYGVSAANLTSSSNGTVITMAKNVVPGCTIGLTGHVMVVTDVIKGSDGRVIQINYHHSETSSGTQDGVTFGYINIGNENQDLNGTSQIWNDTYEPGSVLKNIYTRTILLSSLKNLI